MKKFRLLAAALLFAVTASAQNTAQQAPAVEGYSPTVYLIAVEEREVTPCCDQVQVMSQTTMDYHATHRYGAQQTEKPQFIFATKNNRFSLALGGYVALRAAYDFDGISDNLDFVPYDIPLTADYNNRQQVMMDASTSRLFLKSIANTDALGQVVIYMDADFRGGSEQSYTPRLRSAYISFLGFTFGRDVSTFCDLAAAPTTIDFQGPNAYNFNFATMIRYEFSCANDHLSMGVAAEMPNVSATYSEAYLAMRQRIPDIPVYLQYAWGENRDSHIRASGVFRNMYVRNAVDADNVRLFGWGVQASGTIKVFPALRLFMNGVYGRGITPYIQDLTGSGLDFLPSSTGEDVKVIPMWGWQAAAQINLSRRMFISGGFSMVNVDREEGYSFDNEYKQGRYIFGNIFYKLTPRCSIGAEYLYGSRKNMNSEKNHANRVNLEVKYHF
ncbi:MAG: porin [Alistipes sp.]|nr:porin [Alistipes sp.]MBQ8471060.1 porin [Alistipes sp.]MBQ8916435.1 porin [Alistipes sp.]